MLHTQPHAKQRAAVGGGGSGGHDPAAPPIAPGESWSALLLNPETTNWLVTLLQQLRTAYGPLTNQHATVSALFACM